MHRPLIFCALLAGCALWALPVAATTDLTALIRTEVETASHLHPQVRTIYRERDHRPAWLHEDDARRLYDRLQRATSDGLRRTDLHLDAINALLADTSAARRAQLETRLTHAALTYAEALAGPRVAPARVHPNHWFAETRDQEVTEALIEAMRSPNPPQAVGTLFNRLTPLHPEYRALRRALAERLDRLHDIADVLPRGPLRGVPFAEKPGTGTESLSSELQTLTRDIRLLRLNLERWRWLPEDLGRLHVMVNVPAYTLTVREQRAGRWHKALHLPATVGRTESHWQTPILSDRIRSVVFFPTWTPTVTIQREEILPQARADGGDSLAAHGFVIEQGRRHVDPREIDWSEARPGQHRIVQRGGSKNSLGRLKFVMPNAHYILIHDTHTPEEFDNARRAFSHGCVRAANAPRLAQYLLERVNGWEGDRVAEVMDGPVRTNTVPLRHSVPVHLVYFTAWVDDDGHLHTAEDLYGHDEALSRALGLSS